MKDYRNQRINRFNKCYKMHNFKIKIYYKLKYIKTLP